ncbi:MAG: endonuclease/exonuclease/phosphatase family protein [Akkermansiaceae bacterium]|jgi:exodeoxyribonuclease-3
MIRLLLLCFVLISTHTASAEPLRILTYNVLYGFNHDKAPEIGAQWISEQNPDIVALQELNGFKQGTLEEIAKKWHHDHAIILKERGFPVGLTANSEITVIEKGLDEMWHGFLHCKVKGMNIFVVHLSPSQHAFRMKEAKLLCEKAKPLLDAGETVLFLGDFNCNSPLDQKWLDARPKNEEALDKKTAQARTGNADPNSAVMAQFLALGLIDLVHVKQPTAELERGTFATRLLPQYQTDEQRKDKTWRIDFILADPVLAKRCTSARIPRDKQVDLVSDHYPVEAIFDK